MIQSRIDVLCDKLSERMDTGKPVDMVVAYSALTQDVITEYCFSTCRNILEMEDFSPFHYELMQKPAETSHMCVCPYRVSFLLFFGAHQLLGSSNFLCCSQH